MDWGPYEVFSVISGIALIGMAFAPRLETSNRFFAVLGGAFFVGYGFYVAGQTSGTFEFPIIIFVIPALGVIYLISEIVRHQRKQQRPTRTNSTEE